MKKVFIAVAAVAAVLSVTNVEAKNKTKASKALEVHGIYMNGEIKDVKQDMLETGYLWTVKNRNHKQIWSAEDNCGNPVTVKLKGNDYKSFVKANVDGERSFVKDINPEGRSKHVAKIKEDGEKHVLKDVIRHNGTEVVSYR